MITKKFYQKYLLVLFSYPPEWVLRQYKNMSNFLIFGVFSNDFYIKSPKCHNGSLTTRLIYENEGADQLHYNRAADQCICFLYIDGTIPPLSKSEILSL